MKRSPSQVAAPRAVFAFLLVVGGAAVWGPAGCAGLLPKGPSSERLPDGSYRVKCMMSLPRCLDQAEQVCMGNRYQVLSAADHHDYMGGQGSVGEQEVRTSEAVFRCGPRGRKLWGTDETPASTADAGAAAAPTPPTLPQSKAPAAVCVPGSTQTCVGPAGCAGGQACLPTAAGFSPCDCGPVATPDAGPSPAGKP